MSTFAICTAIVLVIYFIYSMFKNRETVDVEDALSLMFTLTVVFFGIMLMAYGFMGLI